MRVFFLNSETYVDWQQEAQNIDLRQPILESGSVTAHHDFIYQRILRQEGADKMSRRALQEFDAFRPDLVVYSVTWPHECVPPQVTRRMMDSGVPVFTQTWDIQHRFQPFEMEQFYNCTYYGIIDSVTHYFRYRQLATRGHGPNGVVFIAGNNIFPKFLQTADAPAERDLDVTLLGSNEGERAQLLPFLREQLAPYGIGMNKQGGLVDSTRAMPEQGLSDNWVPWDEYARILQRTKIALCSQTQPNRVAVKGKIFHYLAGGALCLIDTNAEVQRVVPKECFVTYTDWQDCVEKIRYYIAHPDERAQIAEAGRAWFFATYDYKRFWTQTLRAMTDPTGATPLPEFAFQEVPGVPHRFTPDEAFSRALCREAVGIASSDMQATYRLGCLALEAQETVPAIFQFQRLASALPRNADVLNKLGEAYFHANETTLANQAFLRALALAPEDANILNNLAVLAWSRGDLQVAWTHIKQAQLYAPDDEGVQANHAAIQAALPHAA